LIVSLALVGSLTAFLIFNLPAGFNRPVLAFMGDAGSTLLGFLLAGLALLAVQPQGENLPPVVILWLLPVPILELFTSTFRRALTGLSPMTADRGHFHYRLLDAGFSVRAVFVLYICISTMSSIFGIRAWQLGMPDSWLFFAFLAFSAVWLVCIGNAKRLTALLPDSLKRGEFHALRRRRTRDSSSSASLKR
jgi:UDP-GlcNAc:undecaprenyl-phosphate/decaprenyl-phosphate GlcNAc-1-phosphate transferase